MKTKSIGIAYSESSEILDRVQEWYRTQCYDQKSLKIGFRILKSRNGF